MGLTRKTKTAKGAGRVERKPASRGSRALPGNSTSGAAAVWHGSSAIEMQPGSPDITVDESGRTVTKLTFAGKLSELTTNRPVRGATIGTYVGRVVTTNLRPGKGDSGTLTVTLRPRDSDQPEPDPEEGTLEDTWEIDWRSVEKPLTTNPKLVDQGSGTTQLVIDEVEAWRNSPQQRKRLYQIPLESLDREAVAKDDEDWVDLAGEALAVAKKIAAGIETWLEFNPVIMHNTIYADPPATGACGVIGAPTLSVTGYVYLKTGDTLVQQADKEWKRTETWQGSAKWDTDLYANA